MQGERRQEKEEKDKKFHRVECSYGSFTRSFTLPVSVDTASVAAKYENGVLAIQLAKKEAAKPKQVKIEISNGAGPVQKMVEGSKAA